MTSLSLRPASSSVGSSAADDAAVRTTGLTRRFGPHTAVDSVDLHVPAGAVYGFLGPNGSGKTTTIRMLLGLVSPHAGEISLLGRRMPDGAGTVLPRVGALIEGPAFHPYLSGRSNLRRLDAFDATADPATGERRVADAIARVGLTAAARKPFRRYSLGMKQRLGIAAALLQRRDLLVLDEPTNGLDPQGTREVRALVRELAAEGTSVLVSSHLLAEVEQIATHVGIMSAGRLVRQGPLADVLGAGTTVVRVTTPDVEAAVEVMARLGIRAELAERDVVTGRLGELAPEVLTARLVSAGVAVRGLAVDRPALEDLFVELTGAGFDVIR